MLRRLPAEPLLASSSSAVLPVCNAKAELFAMPVDELPPVALDDELEEAFDPLALEELETTGWLTGGGVTGANESFALPKPRAAA
jgi:hypothetical protein